jgi:hypothetical protein
MRTYLSGAPERNSPLGTAFVFIRKHLTRLEKAYQGQTLQLITDIRKLQV